MAGADPDDPGFADDFRADIREVFRMALPEVEADRPTFYFADPRTYPLADVAGEPWDYDATPDQPTPPDVPGLQILCGVSGIDGTVPAVERGIEGTSIGEFDPDRQFLMFFEDEWELAKEFTHCTLGGVVYGRGKKLRPLPLWDVTIQRVFVKALDHD